MQSVRDWTLALCCACLVSGLVRILAGGKSRTSVINLVTVLYILLSILRPAAALLGPVSVSLPEAPAAQESVDLTELVRAEAERTLAQQLEQACAEQGITANARVSLRDDGASLALDCVTLLVKDSAQRDDAARLAAEWLGGDAQVLVETGE